MKKTALITGATSGIGEACARKFAEGGYRLIITGRNEQKLNQLKDELDTEVLTLRYDVRDRMATEAAVKSIPEGWTDIDVLINNAGLALGLEP